MEVTSGAFLGLWFVISVVCPERVSRTTCVLKLLEVTNIHTDMYIIQYGHAQPYSTKYLGD